MTDLNYITDGFYITLVPNTKDGEYIYNTIAKAFDGVAEFPAYMKASIFKQIKDAGYTIRKKTLKKSDLTDILNNDVELLNLLNEYQEQNKKGK